MKRALLGLLLAVGLVGGAGTAAGQDEARFYGTPTGCDEVPLRDIEGASPDIDYAAVCEQFLACGDAGRDITICQFEAAARLLANCGAEDVQCRNAALLHAAALTVYSWPSNWDGPCWTEGISFPQAVYHAVLGQYAAALDWLNQGPDIAFCQPMLPYAAGLIEEMRGDQDAALEAYNASLEVSASTITPALFSRGLLLGEMGRETEASFDGEQLRSFLTGAATSALQAMAPLIEGYPFDTSAFTTWWAYPVGARNYSPGGTYLYDHTLEPAFPFEMAVYPEIDQLAIQGFSSTRLLLLKPNTEPVAAGGYRISSLIDGPVFDRAYATDSLGILINDDLMIAARSSNGWEGGGDSTYFVVPPDAPDPRIGLGTRMCEGGVLSILQPGLPVAGLELGGLDLRAEPGGDEWTVERADYAFLSGDPVCLGTDAWWFATTPDGQTGWLPENKGNQYALTQSYIDSFGWMYCPGAPISRLISRASALVLDEPGAGEIYESASNDASLVTTIIPGQVFSVGYERACVDGQVWWKVRTEDGQEGYIAEGEGETYFLEPVFIAP